MESEYGKGSTFHVTIQLKKQPEQTGRHRHTVVETPQQSDSTPATVAIDKPAVATVLHELHALVVENEFSAADSLEKLEPLMADTDYAQHLGHIVRAVEDFDFDEALKAIEQLADELEVDL